MQKVLQDMKLGLCFTGWLPAAALCFWAAAAGATGAGANGAVLGGPAAGEPGDRLAMDSVVQGAQLARQRQCLGCHQVDARRVGPPFRAIAQRFQGQPQAADYLARAIRQGSSGQWGAIPMPAQTRLSDQDARRLAQWILSLHGSTRAAHSGG